GYTRGAAFAGPYAFVGLSKVRETATFGGVPIAERRQELKCGVWVVDCRTGRAVVFLELRSGVDELFDVQVLPGVRAPVVEGPFAAEDGGATIWTVPTHEQAVPRPGCPDQTQSSPTDRSTP